MGLSLHPCRDHEVNPVLPLVIDLDGTLLRTDLLYETAFNAVGRDPFNTLWACRSLLDGKAALKLELARRAALDPVTLPYNEDVLRLIEAARADGRTVHLVSASDSSLVKIVADHLGVFTDCTGSDGVCNLAGHAKAQWLLDRFNVDGFDYAGNAEPDLEIWRRARGIIAVEVTPKLADKAAALGKPMIFVSKRRFPAKAMTKVMRPHQWAKNALIGVPMLSSHQITLTNIALIVLAFLAFSLCASGVYVINDLIDVRADRAHSSKRRRPFASGALPIAFGPPLALLLILSSFAVAIAVSWPFSLALALYFVVTSAYSFVLKRKMMIDTLTLAGLYTIRVFAGAVAISVPLSEWILAFSMFLFLSLALVKRYSELAAIFDSKLPNPSNRNYVVTDLHAILAFAVAAAFSAVLVFALYVSSDVVRRLYVHPKLLWLCCPVLIYWLCRAIMLADRRLMNDDPVVFAIHDRRSWVAGGLIMLIGFLAASPFRWPHF
jgi:4-hydroxybenzoate polyprenyltransferase